MLWQGVDVPFDDFGSSLLGVLGVGFSSSPSDVSIVIVGGGLAGLVAAFEAKSLGFNVRILEGRAHRNGGRIQTKKDFVPGVWAEAGPEFISPSHFFLRWYLEKFGLQLINSEGMEQSPFTPILSDSRINKKEISQQSILFKKILQDRSESLSINKTILTPELEAVDGKTLWSLIEKCDFSVDVMKYLETHLEFENGINPRKIGLLPYLMLIRSHGDGFFENLEKFRLSGGLYQLISAFENELSEVILKKARVLKITSRQRFSVHMDVKSVAQLGSSYDCDAVIITVPPRLWRGGELFDLSLPSELVPQMGDSIKVLIRVPYEISIPTGILPGAFLERDALVQAIWESGIGENSKNRIMTVMCGGSAAERLSRMNQREAASLILAEISRYLPSVQSIDFHGNFYFKDWGRKILTGCGYGCPAPYELTDFRPELMGLLPENLYLCGEWNSVEMWGYMEGAIRSALTAVLKICQMQGATIPDSLHDEMVY